MKPSDEMEDIRNDIAQVKATGVTNPSIDTFDEYQVQRLDIAIAMEPRAGEVAIQAAEPNLEVWKVDAGVRAAMNTEMFKAVTEAGQTALKPLIPIGAGAAAALLAFCGNARTKGQSFTGDRLLASVRVGLAWFVAGFGAVGLATVFPYFSQYCYARTPVITAGSRWQIVGAKFNLVTIAIAFFGFCAFCMGGVTTYSAITSPSQQSSIPVCSMASTDCLPKMKGRTRMHEIGAEVEL